MSKQDEALGILRALGLPRAQQNERSALTLLALANIVPRGKWAKTEKPLLRIWDIMAFMRDKYGKDYAANSRETIRRQTIHQFEQARVVDRNPDDPSRPTNSGNNRYSLTDAAIIVLKAYGTNDFDNAVEKFVRKFGQLERAYNKRRDLQKVKLELAGGVAIQLSPGKHNALQVAVVEEFRTARFAPGALLLYLGDTATKHVICATDELARLSIGITEHDKLPDIVLFDARKNWLFLIEAVTSHGPVNPKRHAEIERMLVDCPADVYVTAFLHRADFRKYAADIAWETEVWIAESPDHMIHFNGPKFLGPYKPHRE